MRDHDRLLVRFMEESNRIEGIHKVTREEYAAFESFLELPEIRIADLCNFVKICAGPRAVLRQNLGMDVQVGQHIAPPGGENILYSLQALLDRVNGEPPFCSQSPSRDPYEIHHEYETLHPFIDGNGRSGRALWAWQMVHDEVKNLGVQALGLGFLHLFYYQALSAGR